MMVEEQEETWALTLHKLHHHLKLQMRQLHQEVELKGEGSGEEAGKIGNWEWGGDGDMEKKILFSWFYFYILNIYILTESNTYRDIRMSVQILKVNDLKKDFRIT